MLGSESRQALESAVEPGEGLNGRIATKTVQGLILGLVIAMAAIGLSLIYSIAHVINFAHGEFVSMGALLALALNVGLWGPQLPLVASAILAVCVVGGFGALVNRFLFKPLKVRIHEHFALLVFTIGLSFLIRFALLFVFGAGKQPYRQYTLQDLVEIGPVALPPRDMVTLAVSIVVLTTLGGVLRWTRTGQALRAVADSPELAGESGIDSAKIERNVWILGAGLAALGGVLLAVSQQASWNLGFNMLMFLFAAVIIGGIGTAFGTLVGGLAVGLAAQLSTLVMPTELKLAVAMSILVVVLLVRPQGLFNRLQRVG